MGQIYLKLGRLCRTNSDLVKPIDLDGQLDYIGMKEGAPILNVQRTRVRKCRYGFNMDPVFHSGLG